MRNVKGFTLIELLIVVIILGVLAGLTIPRLAGRTEKAKIQAARTDITGGIGMALDLYESDMGHYPDNLSKLIEDSANKDQWDGPYLKTGGAPKDPWGREYVYKFPGEHAKKGYDLYSMGPDGEPDTADDIRSWEIKKKS